MSTQSDPHAIRELAYWLWEARGKRDGHAQEDWLEAECRVIKSHLTPASDLSKAVDESGRQSFPASDPPSTHTPDKPPANAQAKWAAVSDSPPETPKVGSKDAPGG